VGFDRLTDEQAAALDARIFDDYRHECRIHHVVTERIRIELMLNDPDRYDPGGCPLSRSFRMAGVPMTFLLMFFSPMLARERVTPKDVKARQKQASRGPRCPSRFAAGRSPLGRSRPTRSGRSRAAPGRYEDTGHRYLPQMKDNMVR
jgi:hypothetical protein